MVFKDLNRKAYFLLGLLSVVSTSAFANLNFIKDNTLFQSPALTIKAEQAELPQNSDFNQILSKHQNWIEQVDYDSSRYHVNYTFNEELETFIKKQLKRKEGA